MKPLLKQLKKPIDRFRIDRTLNQTQKYKSFKYSIIALGLAFSQIPLFGIIPTQKAVAQTSCPAGTREATVNWQPAVGAPAIAAQNIDAGGVGVRFSFTESIPGQVIENDLVPFRGEVYGTRIDNDVYGGLPGPNLRLHIGIGKEPSPGSATLTITFDRPVTFPEPLTLLDVDRDGARDGGFVFQDMVTVNAFNGDNPVGVSLRSLGNNNRVNGNVVAGINENSFPNRGDGNAAVSITDPVTSVSFLYEPGMEFGPPGQDQTIGLARFRICVPLGSIGDEVFIDTNGNGVRDEGEGPLPNATLILRDRDGQEIGRTTTNSNGIYGFNDLELGDYSVEVLRPEDFTPTTETTLNASLTPANPSTTSVDFGLRPNRVGTGDTPNIRVVKRITNAFRNGQPLPVANFNTFNPDPNSDNDDNLPGQERFLGVPQIQTLLQSGDEVEYTIYFLTEGEEALVNTRFCDLVPEGTTFVNNSISVNGAGSDAQPPQFFTPLAPLGDFAAVCGGNNTNGAVINNLGTLPTNTFGFVRFRVGIN